MAVYSMTGYANVAPSVDAATGNAGVSIELRSVNSRFLDLALRLPDELRALEPALRELLNTAFRRGKIELRLATQHDSDNAWPQPTPEQLNRLGRLETQVQGWLPQARALSVNEALLWCRGAAVAERLDEAALQAARDAIEATLGIPVVARLVIVAELLLAVTVWRARTWRCFPSSSPTICAGSRASCGTGNGCTSRSPMANGSCESNPRSVQPSHRDSVAASVPNVNHTGISNRRARRGTPPT